MSRKRRGYNTSAVKQRARVAALRLRDGDACWLCGEVIDFTLPQNDPREKSIDHVIPLSAGGPNACGNRRLAHRACNSARLTRYPGTIPGEEVTT